ncbi:PAN domain-containing protein [Loa loa]|uniref:PAN domain-containing protein n=1 Tax=Loa loa TaxID=7209 RepID=A0A1S0U4V4_LOALO|nr:PAN domain-containing protein [Loa loa]EFO24509.1 PAN domain-containing protein [Loa loa]
MFGVRSFSNDTRMRQKCKTKKKQTKSENIATDQMDQKEKLAKACYGDGKGSNDSDDQESSILVIYTGKDNNLIENKLQDTGKYQHLQQCFYVIDNCALSTTAPPFKRRIGISLLECAQFCSSLPGCLSASYSTPLSICDVYHFKFGLRGKKVMKSLWHYYLEPQPNNAPGCFLDEGCPDGENVVVTKAPGWRIAKFNGQQIAELCDGTLIERQPQHILVTFPDAILTTSTLVKCLLKCFWSLQDGRTFQCHSLMYFYEQEVDNCILNSRSKRNHPNSLKEETVSVVDYFGLDECLNISLMDQVSKTNLIGTYRYKKHQDISITRRTRV